MLLYSTSSEGDVLLWASGVGRWKNALKICLDIAKVTG